jgi:CHRD domain
MRRLLAVLVPLVMLAACGDDDDAVEDPTVVGEDSSESTTEADETEQDVGAGAEVADTTVPQTTVPTDSPAGDAPGDGAEDDEGLGDALLVSDLDGGAEVPGPGDPAATGRFEAELHDGVLCVDMDVSGLGAAVTGAHLHDGTAGDAGPVIVDVGDPTSTAGDLVQWVDACTEVPDDVIQRIAEAPERVYVNVHTGAHPDGAVRGQLAVAAVFDRTLDR